MGEQRRTIRARAAGRWARLLAMLGVVGALLLAPNVAQAHYARTLGGTYLVEVGFRNEPPLVDQLNAAQIAVFVPAEGNRPVRGLETTLRAEVIVGGNAKQMALDLQAVEGEPGTYAGSFTPTREGSYIFRFFGQIESLAVDERFESGPGRFEDVTAAEDLQFPDKLPTAGQAAAEARAARAAVESATWLAIAALVVGALGLGLAAYTLLLHAGGRGQGV